VKTVQRQVSRRRPSGPKPAATLRTRAESALRATRHDLARMSPEEVKRLVHELQVHQIELELQNEELRQIQAELAQSRDRYTDLYDFAPAGYLTLESRGVILEANLTIARMLGVARADLLKRNLSRFVARKSQDTFYLCRREVFSSGRAHTCELALKRADGTAFPVQFECAAYTDPATQTPCCRTVVLDVAGRRRTEQALQESEERYRRLFEVSSDAVILLDYSTGKVLDANAAAEKFYGRTLVELRRMNVHELSAEPAKSRKAIAKRQLWIPLRWHRRKDGTTFPVEISARHFNYQGREVRVSTIRDITDRQAAEAQLKRYSQQLRALSRKLVQSQENERRHIARELHDQVGQALTAIQINLQTALALPDASGVPSRLEESLQLVDELVQQTQDLSFSLRPSLLDDLGLEAALRWLADRQAARAGWQLNFRADPLEQRLDPAIETACFRVAQEAFTNVLRHAQPTEVRVQLQREEQTLRLAISDNGVGFDVAAARDGTRHRTGLGLVTMEERAILAGGRLEIHARPGAGTTVQARFPLKWRSSKTAVESD
jgi:PAS domain S-box-containing protein